MTEKNSINNKLRKKFDKGENYNQILSRIEKENNMGKKKNNWSWQRLAVAPVCLLLIIGGIMLLQNDETTNFVPSGGGGNRIVINKLESIGSARLDIDIRYDADEKFDEFGFINDMKIPSGFDLHSKYLVYVKRFCETKEECVGAPYDTLHDYVVRYENVAGKSIEVAFSKDFEPLRDYNIKDENLKASKINGTDVVVASHNEMFIATFRYDNLNFDIETNGVSETELVGLLESIL